MVSFEGIYLFFQNETLAAAILVFTYIVGIIVLESFILWLLYFISKPILSFAAGLLLAANFFVLKLDYSSFFQGFSDYLVILLITSMGLIFGLIVNGALKNEKKPGIPLLLYAGIIFVLVPLALSSSLLLDTGNVNDSVHKNVLRPWKDIHFKDKPNLHLISFDSMIPGGIAQKYLDIQDQDLPYAMTINTHMLKMKISLSPGSNSRTSLNNTMNLDQKNINHNLGYFAGRRPSILTAIAESNGYVVTTGFSNNFFGKKGPYINNYEIFKMPTIKESILCIDDDSSSIFHARLYGVCTTLGSFSNIHDLFKYYFYDDGTAGNSIFTEKEMGNSWAADEKISNKWVSKVFSNIENIASDASPQLSFHYIYRPLGHTPKNYRHANLQQRLEYKDYFVENAEKLDAILNNLILLIEKNDPNSIVVIFGDHGAWMSRGISGKENNKFLLQDRHQIELALLKTKNVCASDKAFHYSPSFTTPSRVLAAIFRCLAEEPKKVDKLVGFLN